MILIGFLLIVGIAIVIAMNASSKTDALARRVRALEETLAGPEPETAIETTAEPDALPSAEEAN